MEKGACEVHLYLGDIIRCDGQEVDFVSQALGGLDSGNVGVDQHSLDVLFLESLNSLESKRKHQNNVNM